MGKIIKYYKISSKVAAFFQINTLTAKLEGCGNLQYTCDILMYFRHLSIMKMKDF